jgi:hypothetical protein
MLPCISCILPLLIEFMTELNISERWLRHCAPSRKIAGSNSDSYLIFFNVPNPSSRTMALGLTQPLSEMSTKNLPLGGGGVEVSAAGC